jgi:hypothetical protein
MADDLKADGDHAAVLQALRAGPGRLIDDRVDALLLARWGAITDAGTRLAVAKLLAERPTEGAQRVLLAAIDDPIEDVRLEVVRGLRDAVALRGADFKRDAARALGQRLQAERSPRVLELLYALASGPLFCETSGQNDEDHRCPTALTRSLEQLARKGERAAIQALRGHPSAKELDFFLGALEQARDDAQRQELVGALQVLTGIGLTSNDAALWRKQLTPLPPQAQAVLAQLSASGARQARHGQERAQSRIDQLRALAAAQPPR